MPKRKTNSRSYSTRQLDIREVKQRFLIVCEGKKTEPYYFKSFRVPKAVVAIEGAAGDPTRLVNSAYKLANEDKLSELLGVKYRKNDSTIYQQLLAKQEIAIKYARKLLESYNSIDPERNNPSTTVHLLVDALNEFV
jgi:hypothetical protein